MPGKPEEKKPQQVKDASDISPPIVGINFNENDISKLKARATLILEKWKSSTDPLFLAWETSNLLQNASTNAANTFKTAEDFDSDYADDDAALKAYQLLKSYVNFFESITALREKAIDGLKKLSELSISVASHQSSLDDNTTIAFDAFIASQGSNDNLQFTNANKALNDYAKLFVNISELYTQLGALSDIFEATRADKSIKVLYTKTPNDIANHACSIIIINAFNQYKQSGQDKQSGQGASYLAYQGKLSKLKMFVEMLTAINTLTMAGKDIITSAKSDQSKRFILQKLPPRLLDLASTRALITLANLIEASPNNFNHLKTQFDSTYAALNNHIEELKKLFPTVAANVQQTPSIKR